MSRIFPSLQSKLIAAFVAVTVVSLAVSAAVFVRLSQSDQRQRAIDHVASESGVIYAGFLVRQFEGGGITVLTAYARDIGHEHDVRILITDRSRVVVSDTGKELEGKQLTVIADNSATTLGGRFTRLQVAGSAAEDLLLLGPSREVFGMERPPFGMRPDDPQVTIENVATAGGDGEVATPSPTAAGRAGRDGPRVMREQPLAYQLVLAVPASDLTHAWLALVPGLGLAASLALPAAVLLAVLLARSITRPLRDLTRATGLVAEGRFDVAVPAARGDEVGELASSFSTMTRRVGESQAEQRRLIADVSHNLKTPLTSILGFSSALASGHAATPEEAARMGSVIHDEAGRLAARLGDLLFLSELESGQAVLDEGDVALSALVESVFRRVAGAPGDEGPRWETSIAAGVIVPGDAARLERAVENLLSNARKFGPAGSVARVTLRAEGGRARLEVTNAAPELEEEQLPRLFDRFYRARPNLRNGTGLGLPIARDIARKHEGTLDAALADGQVTFTLTLPLSEA